MPLPRSRVWDAGFRRPIDCAVDPVFHVERTLNVCELSYIGFVGRAWRSRFCTQRDSISREHLRVAFPSAEFALAQEGRGTFKLIFGEIKFPQTNAVPERSGNLPCQKKKTNENRGNAV